jgi:hypothetical protein
MDSDAAEGERRRVFNASSALGERRDEAVRAQPGETMAVLAPFITSRA